MFLQNLGTSTYDLGVNGVTIEQNGTISGGSSFTTGETIVGNLGFFSANTCNMVAFGNSSAASSATANSSGSLLQMLWGSEGGATPACLSALPKYCSY